MFKYLLITSSYYFLFPDSKHYLPLRIPLGLGTFDSFPICCWTKTNRDAKATCSIINDSDKCVPKYGGMSLF